MEDSNESYDGILCIGISKIRFRFGETVPWGLRFGQEKAPAEANRVGRINGIGND